MSLYTYIDRELRAREDSLSIKSNRAGLSAEPPGKQGRSINFPIMRTPLLSRAQRTTCTFDAQQTVFCKAHLELTRTYELADQKCSSWDQKARSG